MQASGILCGVYRLPTPQCQVKEVVWWRLSPEWVSIAPMAESTFQKVTSGQKSPLHQVLSFVHLLYKHPPSAQLWDCLFSRSEPCCKGGLTALLNKHSACAKAVSPAGAECCREGHQISQPLRDFWPFLLVDLAGVIYKSLRHPSADTALPPF